MSAYDRLVAEKCPTCGGFGQTADPANTQLDPVPPLSCEGCYGTGLRWPTLSRECPGVQAQEHMATVGPYRVDAIYYASFHSRDDCIMCHGTTRIPLPEA